jgi:hypothetical protein
MTKPSLGVDPLLPRTAAGEAEIDQLRQTLNQGHYLRAGRPAGHVLWQGIHRTDTESGCPELVAVLCRGGAAKRLKERDNHIGWDAVTCANRLKLIVQLRRFYVIDSARRPNLASQCLALSLRTLRHALRGLTDTRNPKAVRHPFSAMLTLIVYGLIGGARDVKAIWQKCAPLDQNQRRAIGLTRRNPETGLLTMPGYGALNDIVNRIDPVELARVLNAWLTENSELLPKSLALDGKSIGAKGRLGGIVTLCFQATGQPLAQRTYSGKKDDCELPVAQRLLDKDAAARLEGALVTGDALDARKKRHASSPAMAATGRWRTRSTGSATPACGRKTPRVRARKPAEARCSPC